MRILAILLALVALTIAAIAAPDEELLGKSAGYPIGTPGNWSQMQLASAPSGAGCNQALWGRMQCGC
jgi:hypothetical protein